VAPSLYFAPMREVPAAPPLSCFYRPRAFLAMLRPAAVKLNNKGQHDRWPVGVHFCRLSFFMLSAAILSDMT
jgi:hypothetical protein